MRGLVLAFVVLVLVPVAVAGAGSAPAQTRVVATGVQPCGATVGRGGVWIGVYGTGRLLRVDLRSGRVTRRIAVGPWACRVALAGRSAWVTRDRADTIVRVDLRTGTRRAIAVDASPFDVLHAAGAIWATSFERGSVTRIDPTTGTATRIETGGFPAGLAYCAGRVWAGHGRSATWLTAIDPATLEVTRAPAGGASPGWPSCIRGALWVTTPDSVLRMSTEGSAPTQRLRLGGTPAHAAEGPDGLVWVTDKERSLVHRVGPDLTLVDSFPAGRGAFAVVRAGSSMWVTSFAGADARRFTP